MTLLVARRPLFARLWSAQVVSEGGDWLNRMAIFELIRQLSGSTGVASLGIGLLYGLEVVSKLAPHVVVGPLAGPLADRLPRRALMVTTDIVRALIVLSMCFVREASQLPLLYALIVLQMTTATFFSAARSASVPNTVERSELHEAYAWTAVTWSTMLSVGAVLGGLLVDAIGIRGVFLVDAGTYLVSALILAGMRLPPVPRHPDPFRWRDILLLVDLRRGLAHVRELRVLPAVGAKIFWGGAGGYLTMLAVMGAARFGTATLPLAIGTATAWLYAARGLGTGIGPILAKRCFGSSDRMLRRQITGGFAVGALGYALVGRMETLPLALAFVVFAHMGGSTIWVASTTLWQRHVDDAFRGRVFAFEFVAMTLGFCLGALLAGWVYDETGSVARTLDVQSGLVAVMGSAWTLWAWRAHADDAPVVEGEAKRASPGA